MVPGSKLTVRAAVGVQYVGYTAYRMLHTATPAPLSRVSILARCLFHLPLILYSTPQVRARFKKVPIQCATILHPDLLCRCAPSAYARCAPRHVSHESAVWCKSAERHHRRKATTVDGQYSATADTWRGFQRDSSHAG